MMDQRCRQVPETFEVCHVDVAILDERVFNVQGGSCIYRESTISIVDDTEEDHPRVVVRDMHGEETFACSLDREMSRVRFVVGLVVF